ncbi:MAG TPA: sigma-70 family RNA polymerase sigma factor [Gemmataceae bacterium]|nr:sigma-70 family RNA polymerase sigma factor [Gemmataceae bacterium]
MARSTPYADCSDEELLAFIRQGTREAFGALVRRYEGALYGYLRRYLGDSDLADDVFQNTFLQVYTKLHQFEAGRPVRPWLYAIATNQAIDALRRQNRHQALQLYAETEEMGEAEGPQLLGLLETRELGPIDHLQGEERKQLIRSSVDRLPDFLKQVVLLAYYQGLKYKDVADILGIPVGTVKSRLHTALSRLQEAWSAEPALQD